MALKYWLEYPDMVNIIHRLEIYDDNFTDPEIQINGSVFLDYSSSDGPVEAIRGNGLRVELEADQDLTFQDLYSQEQKSFLVIYYRDSIIQFKGWLNPEGWHEDWVRDTWKVTFDCVDGLGYLEDLSFINSNNGTPVSGRRSLLNCLSIALQRTGINQNINIDINIFYTGLDSTLSILDNVFMNTERYVKDDETTLMSCIQVIRDILEPFAACIVSKNGEWFIFRPNQLALSTELNYFRYDYLGAPIDPVKGTTETAFLLGSQINGMYPHHCSANQQKNIRNSIGAYRISYKYGQLEGILQNPYLCYEGVPPTGDMPGWTISDQNNDITYGACGVELPLKAVGYEQIVLYSDDMLVANGVDLDFKFKGDIYRYPQPEDSTFNYRISLTDGNNADVYSLTAGGLWQLGTFKNSVTYTQNNSWIIEIIAETTPVGGSIKIEVFAANGTGDVASWEFNLDEINITNKTETSIIEGEFHTVQRTDNPSSKVEDTKEVVTGDNSEENYVGALYQNDANTPTSTWYRPAYNENVKILQIMAEETLRMSPTPGIVFMGDVYGFFEYLSVVTIQGLEGLYMVMEYSYDTRANIIGAKFTQIFGAELPDIYHEISYDYGKTVKPTIK